MAIALSRRISNANDVNSPFFSSGYRHLQRPSGDRGPVQSAGRHEGAALRSSRLYRATRPAALRPERRAKFRAVDPGPGFVPWKRSDLFPRGCRRSQLEGGRQCPLCDPEADVRVSGLEGPLWVDSSRSRWSHFGQNRSFTGTMRNGRLRTRKQSLANMPHTSAVDPPTC